MNKYADDLQEQIKLQRMYRTEERRRVMEDGIKYRNAADETQKTIDQLNNQILSDLR